MPLDVIGATDNLVIISRKINSKKSIALTESGLLKVFNNE